MKAKALKRPVMKLCIDAIVCSHRKMGQLSISHIFSVRNQWRRWLCSWCFFLFRLRLANPPVTKETPHFRPNSTDLQTLMTWEKTNPRAVLIQELIYSTSPNPQLDNSMWKSFQRLMTSLSLISWSKVELVLVDALLWQVWNYSYHYWSASKAGT